MLWVQKITTRPSQMCICVRDKESVQQLAKHDCVLARGHRVGSKEDKPAQPPAWWPPTLFCSTAPRESAGVCRAEGTHRERAGPLLQRAHRPVGKAGQIPQNLKITTWASVQLQVNVNGPQRSLCEAVSTYSGLSRA